MLLIFDEDRKFKIPLFTSLDVCNAVIDGFEDIEPKIWPLVNIISYIGSENFDGVVINPDVDNFSLSKEMIDEIYLNHEQIDYWHIFSL